MDKNEQREIDLESRREAKRERESYVCVEGKLALQSKKKSCLYEPCPTCRVMPLYLELMLHCGRLSKSFSLTTHKCCTDKFTSITDIYSMTFFEGLCKCMYLFIHIQV